MTDTARKKAEEIIRGALEGVMGASSAGGPFTGWLEVMRDQIAALIAEKDAEIAGLNEAVLTMEGACEAKDAEIERLKKSVSWDAATALKKSLREENDELRAALSEKLVRPDPTTGFLRDVQADDGHWYALIHSDCCACSSGDDPARFVCKCHFANGKIGCDECCSCLENHRASNASRPREYAHRHDSPDGKATFFGDPALCPYCASASSARPLMPAEREILVHCLGAGTWMKCHPELNPPQDPCPFRPHGRLIVQLPGGPAVPLASTSPAEQRPVMPEGGEPMPCPRCKQTVMGSWAYCAWCGLPWTAVDASSPTGIRAAEARTEDAKCERCGKLDLAIAHHEGRHIALCQTFDCHPFVPATHRASAAPTGARRETP